MNVRLRILLISFALFSFVPTLVSAQDASDSTRTRLQEVRQTVTERRETQRDEFRERLSEIRDTRKRALVENLDKKFNAINERWVTRWTAVVTRLDTLLGKVESRANTLEEDGIDVSRVRSAIAAAETVLDDAQEALRVQADKEYSITLTDEEGLRADVGAVAQELRDDLEATKEIVQDAAQAVRAALGALKDLSDN